MSAAEFCGENKGIKIETKYEIGDKLGSGAFSIVKKGKRLSDKKEFAIKIIRKKDVKLPLLEREIEIMKKLKHPHVLPLFEVFEDSENIFLVLQLIEGGELFDRIIERGNYSEKEAAKIVKQILEAVKYLHSQGVVHRDLKPENLLVRDKAKTNLHIFAADFGLSRVFSGSGLLTYCGSPEYVAPEVLSMKPYNPQVDVWSIGVITYILLTGFLPFYDKNHTILFEKNSKCRLQLG